MKKKKKKLIKGVLVVVVVDDDALVSRAESLEDDDDDAISNDTCSYFLGVCDGENKKIFLFLFTRRKKSCLTSPQ